MLIVTGTILVLLTWAGCALFLMLVGIGPAVLTAPGRLTWREVRAAMWWGLLAVTIVAYLANLALPLGSTATALLMGVVAAGGAMCAVAIVRTRRLRLRWTTRGWAVAIWLAVGLSAVYMAATALGPVTNYDSGLYHLGAIRYAADFATIPGLANLYFPFGYGNAEFPLAALLGNGPWGEEGFRLLNGLIMLLVSIDLVLRSVERRIGTGFFVLVAGVVAAWVPMVALADYWVTSPTQDSAVLFVTMAAAAYLADSMRGGRSWVADAGVAAVLALLLVLLRPTMLAFALGLLGVVALRAWRRPAAGAPRLGLTMGVFSIFALVTAGAATARDYLLSGWLQYPLSVLAFDVPWRADDPSSNRSATLGFHRNPNDLWEAAQSWGWIGPWLGRLPTYWETYLVATGVLVAAVVIVLAVRASGPAGRWRAMTACLAPSLFMVAVWWLATPPSFRFAWGPLFTCVTIPIGWSLWVLASRAPDVGGARKWSSLVAAGVAVPIVLVTAYSGVARFDWASITADRRWTLGVSIPYGVAPVPSAAVTESLLTSGLRILTPISTEQCWWTYPLCTPQVATTIAPRGPSLAEGLLP